MNSIEHLQGEPVTEDNLLSAVKKLTRVVEALEITLKRDYPTRIEIRRRRGQIVAATRSATFAT